MKNYEKPIILANNELSEGVFAASGAVAGGGTASGNDSLSVTASITGNDGNKTSWYKVEVVNNSSEAVSNWSTQLSFNGTIKGAVSYYGNVSYSGTVLTVSFDTIAAGTTYTFSGAVTGDSVLSF